MLIGPGHCAVLLIQCSITENISKNLIITIVCGSARSEKRQTDTFQVVAVFKRRGPNGFYAVRQHDVYKVAATVERFFGNRGGAVANDYSADARRDVVIIPFVLISRSRRTDAGRGCPIPKNVPEYLIVTVLCRSACSDKRKRDTFQVVAVSECEFTDGDHAGRNRHGYKIFYSVESACSNGCYPVGNHKIGDCFSVQIQCLFRTGLH